MINGGKHAGRKHPPFASNGSGLAETSEEQAWPPHSSIISKEIEPYFCCTENLSEGKTVPERTKRQGVLGSEGQEDHVLSRASISLAGLAYGP